MRRDRRAGVLILILVAVLGSVCRVEAIPVTWAAAIRLTPPDTDTRAIHRRIHGSELGPGQPGVLPDFGDLLTLAGGIEAWIVEESAWSSLREPNVSISLSVGYLESAMACDSAGVLTPEGLASCVAEWQRANPHSARGWLVLVAPGDIVAADEGMAQEIPPPVPEPSTGVLVGASLVLLGLKAWKRR